MIKKSKRAKKIEERILQKDEEVCIFMKPILFFRTKSKTAESTVRSIMVANAVGNSGITVVPIISILFILGARVKAIET